MLIALEYQDKQCELACEETHYGSNLEEFVRQLTLALEGVGLVGDIALHERD